MMMVCTKEFCYFCVPPVSGFFAPPRLSVSAVPQSECALHSFSPK
ncbi:Hypothetical protein, putative [Bodo saltans]|uniref:Uncharacterized protein n=1 Tax=Bodo saltans TaxID=75058 RepID=A0A0S4IND9_BODSA|nr:Hypothetical protein, putative [Bodo saltans]|eukprot:CUE59450.1 Hypothetical protein, putative [Bodo saltans]